jgi:large subunit ribosomal protein L13
MVVIDAQGAVIGRLGARVAKLLLAGTSVEIVNADKAVMVGSLDAAKEKYLSRRSQKNKRNPDESPHWPRVPNLFLRRMIRGMLPHKSRRGRDAYRLLTVINGAPVDGSKLQTIKEASSASKHRTFMLSELSEALGYHKVK